MTRTLLIAAIVAVTSVVTIGSTQAGCHGRPCVTGYGFNDFYARFGCTPQQAFLMFRQNPELITRFPEAARLLETQFGAITPATATTPAVVSTPAVATTPAVAATPATDAAVVADTAVATTDPVVTPPAAAATPATPAPVVDAASATPAVVDGAEIAAPVVTDQAAAPVDPPAAAPVQAELEPLLGLWINESDAANQPIAKINLAGDGNATVTLNTALGQTDVTKPFAIDGDTFKLDGNDLATVVSALTPTKWFSAPTAPN